MSIAPNDISAAGTRAGGLVPPLENGDHLTRAEFERRYDAMPDLKKAELIEGKVFVAPPAYFMGHGREQFGVIGLLAAYQIATPGVLGGDNTSLRLEIDNMPQPDVFVLIESACGGQSKIEGRYVVGAPELVMEIAATSPDYDLNEKLLMYRANGVRQYIVWRTLDNQIDYFILNEGEYIRHVPDADGVYHSAVFPGLRLDAAALLNGDFAAALSRIQEGIASPEHAAFVALLESRKTKGAGR